MHHRSIRPIRSILLNEITVRTIRKAFFPYRKRLMQLNLSKFMPEHSAHTSRCNESQHKFSFTNISVHYSAILQNRWAIKTSLALHFWNLGTTVASCNLHQSWRTSWWAYRQARLWERVRLLHQWTMCSFCLLTNLFRFRLWFSLMTDQQRELAQTR
jgi:hypothetical protein